MVDLRYYPAESQQTREEVCRGGKRAQHKPGAVNLRRFVRLHYIYVLARWRKFVCREYWREVLRGVS